MSIIRRGDLRPKRGTTRRIANWSRSTEITITPINIKLDRAVRHCERVAKAPKRLSNNVIRCRRA